eukprot:TRINITY_DN3434_c0_g1_i1.p1 TRINITY_DN3434_c0_g1~~TRINITY_DN3434_c0_g1_i1.p1  ORF type:complete len:309 (+),score=64.68 TRINITY_DN3434_c0_g1_i1:277-1203(+)
MIGDYRLGRKLGGGNESSCFEAFKKGDNQKYCLKFIKEDKEGKVAKKVKKEIEVLMKLRGHMNIISLREHFVLDYNGEEIYCIVTDLFKMDLHQYLKRSIKRKLKEDVCRKISYQIIDALLYCHKNYITHHDLKLQNIIIDPPTLKIKLIDFGFSTISCSEEEICNLGDVLGSPYYVSPEKFLFTKYDGRKSDTWSVGVLIFKMITGKYPFGEYSKSVVELSKCVMFDEPTLPNCSPMLRDLLVNMLKKKPRKRISLYDSIVHKWFNNEEFISYKISKNLLKNKKSSIPNENQQKRTSLRKSKSLTSI